jgi:4-hydroxybenzoate polyprenyltransferase
MDDRPGYARRVRSGPVATWAGLARAAHPEPALAVTGLAVVLAASSGVGPGRLVVIGVAVLAGQLSVGWSNDLLDVARDRAAGRRDKPLATGALSGALVRVAVGVALVVTTAASLLVGLAPGALHLALVATGWSYNLWLKRSVWSWVPYAVCFGMLPVVVALVPPDRALPPPWMPAAGVLLGVGAHLVNAVPDLDDDRRTGVRGLPHRLGARWSLDLATVLLVAGSLVAVLGPAGRVGTLGVGALVLVVAVAAAGRALGGRQPFRAALVVAAVDVIALVLQG